MADIFTPQSKTIQELFDGGNYYQVPSYQRPYSWDTEQVDDLWEDVYSAFDNDEEEYFLGSIILTKNGDNKYLDVVDGQQRLTTLMILFCVLRDLYYSKHKDITKKNRIEGRIKNLENGYERLKLRTQTQNQNQFEQEILNGINFEKFQNRKDVKENKFLNTALKFREKISPLLVDEETIEQVTEYLLDRVRVISITCSNQSFAIKLFQVLNNRGLDLTPADLIKSFLMGNLKDEDQKTFEQEWIYVENKSKDLSEELTNLLTYYEYYLLASNPKKSLYKELEILFRGKDPLAIIYEFKKMIDLFSDIDKESPKEIYPLYYLRHDVYWKSIILTAMLEEWDHEDTIRLSHLLRKFYFLYWIADYTSSKIKQTSFNIISWIKKGGDFDFIKNEILTKIKSDKVITRVKENLDGNIYSSPWSKPLLVLLEYEQVDTPSMNFISIDKDIHLEHILPQSYSEVPFWSSKINPEVAEKLVNTLGNLTLLSGKKNIEASNSPFDEKIKIYTGKGKDGLTHFIITQKIAQENIDWNADLINKRKLFLISEIERVFEINFEKDIEDEKKQEKLDSLSQESEKYSEEQHLEGRDEGIKQIYQKIISFVRSLDEEVEINPQRYYISLRKDRNFAFVRVKNKKIKIVIMLPYEKFVSKVKTHKVRQLSKSVQNFYNGPCFDIIIERNTNLEEIFELLKEAIKNK